VKNSVEQTLSYKEGDRFLASQWSLAYMECECSLSCEHAAGPYPELDECSPHPHILCLEDQF
jgi:hypothetical protein